MTTASPLQRLRPLYLPLLQRSPTLRLAALLVKGGPRREPEWVSAAYDDVWNGYRHWLDAATKLEDWLYVPGFDDRPQTFHLAGRVAYTTFDHRAFCIDLFVDVLKTYFPEAQSLTEYGCGSGKNLLALKRRLPHLDFYGYELAAEGVDVARAAAKKFDLPVEYAKLDYVNDGPEAYVHPKTDVAFTCYSFEQIPHDSGKALRHVLDHVEMGSFHLEPVCENYPLTYRGVLGRVYTREMDMLQGFDRAARGVGARTVRQRTLETSHNPLMYPSLYVLEK